MGKGKCRSAGWDEHGHGHGQGMVGRTLLGYSLLQTDASRMLEEEFPPCLDMKEQAIARCWCL